MATKKPRKTKKSQTTVIPCEGSLDIAMAHELYQTLQQAVETSTPLVIDVANVEHIDTAVLQLLCAFMQETQARGIAVQWHKPSPAVTEAAHLLGLENLLFSPVDVNENLS
jgi:anti-anti-sigma factor